MHAYAAAGAGFLLAVLWFDLMFDVQTRKHDGSVLSPEEQSVLARSIDRAHCFSFVWMGTVLVLPLMAR